MKLFLTVVLASVLMMKTAEGADAGAGEACETGTTECSAASNSNCVDSKCACKATYVPSTAAPTLCKLKSGETCAAADECAVNACTNKKCGKKTGEVCAAPADCAANACTDLKCGMKNGEPCNTNSDCVTGNCKYDDGSEKCADAGAAGVVASVLLMVATLMTSRIL